MNKLFSILFFTSIFLNTAIGQEKTDLSLLLNKEWKYDEVSLPIVQEKVYVQLVAEAEKAGDKKKVKELKQNKTAVLHQLKELLDRATFTYKNDNTVQVKIGGDLRKENWSYNKANRTISTTNLESGRITTSTIKYASNSRFEFIDDTGNTLIFVLAEGFNPLSFKEDLAIYREIIEKAHSGLYLYTSKEEFDALFAKAEQQIPTLRNTREFYNIIADIHSQIYCGHSSFYTSDDIFSEIESEDQKAFFPFKIKFLEDKMVVAEDSQNLKKGDEITIINGRSIKEITDQTFKLISSDGYNTTFKYRQLEDDFSTNYYLAFGPSAAFKLSFITYESATNKKITVEGVTLNERQNTITESHYDRPYYLEYQDAKTAVLTVNTFSTQTEKNQKKFFKFLKKSFKEIQDKNIKKLIIDVRENTGGDDGNDMELASYLIDKPFKENKFRKLNDIENFPPFIKYLHSDWFEMLGISQDESENSIQKMIKGHITEEAKKGKDGYYYWNEDAILKRDPAKYRFTGDTYVLTSGKVFSGGAVFSALVRDKSNSIFIGEETGGGYYRHTGTLPLFYKLPNSNFVFSIFTVIGEQDVDQKLVPEGHGTQPQFEVYQTKKEFVDGVDAVMQKALKMN